MSKFSSQRKTTKWLGTALGLASLIGAFQSSSMLAQDPSFSQSASASLFPKEVQGFVCVRDLPMLVERWNMTQFGLLSKLDGMKQFWDEQRQEIETRLIDAGWQLNIRPQDIYDVTSGEVGLAWIERSNPKKPYSVAICMMVKGKEAEANALLGRIGEELKAKKATAQQVTMAGTSVSKYTLARKSNDAISIESYFARVGDWILAADEAETIQFMLAAQANTNANALSSSDIFKQAFSNLKAERSHVDFEYFVRPIGFAKVMRSISKQQVTPRNDLLKLLENQGFGAIPAVCGRVSLSEGKEYDVFHDGFVVANNPLPRSVQVLDFPNQCTTTLPPWAVSSLSGAMALSWNVKDAFWKVDGIVDDYADDENTFKNMIAGIQTDPLGPQVDINNDVMPFLTNEIYSFNDCVSPITPDSKRSLIAIRLTETSKLKKILNRVMGEEQDAVAIDFQGVRIWKKTNEVNQDLKLDLEEFEVSRSSKRSKEVLEEERKDPWLNQWSVAIHQDYFLFASHAELIQEVVSNSGSADQLKRLENEADYQRALAAIQRVTQGKPTCIWQVDRADKSFEMQYELFRQDKLPQSRSMMASLLDRLLHPKSENRDATQKVKGDRLPEFGRIKPYLMPSGLVVQSMPHGWAIHSFVLGKDATTGGERSSALTADRSEEVAETNQGETTNPTRTKIR